MLPNFGQSFGLWESFMYEFKQIKKNLWKWKIKFKETEKTLLFNSYKKSYKFIIFASAWNWISKTNVGCKFVSNYIKLVLLRFSNTKIILKDFETLPNLA